MKENMIFNKTTMKTAVDRKNDDELHKHREIISALIEKKRKNDKEIQVEKSKNTKGTTTTKKSIGPSTSNTRLFEEKIDKVFLGHFLESDDKKNIDAQNLHLLTDDDSNLSITAREKYQKLADLMMDDKEIIVEHSFSNNPEEKMILNLFSALSRKSKQVFIEEDEVKINKLQVFLKRINGIPNLQEMEEDEDYLIQNITSNRNLEAKRRSSFNEDVYAENIKNAPKISSEFLSNINHNFISIEDIYNSNEKKKEKKEEENLFKGPIKAVDVTKKNVVGDQSIDSNNLSQTEQNVFNTYFSKFEINNQKERDKEQLLLKEKIKLKKIQEAKSANSQKIHEICVINEKMFPRNNTNMTKEDIYIVAVRNTQLEITRQEIDEEFILPALNELDFE